MEHRAAWRIRPATSDDLEALAGLESSAFADPWSSPGIASFWAGAGARAWIAEAPGGPAVGSALWREIAGEAELLRVATAPQRRREGIARALLEAALADFDRAGVDCHLEVRADNLAAQALYASLGFELTGRRKGYYRDDCDAWLYARKAQP